MAVLGGEKSPISERAEFDGSPGRVTDQARIAAIVMPPPHLVRVGGSCPWWTNGATSHDRQLQQGTASPWDSWELLSVHRKA